MGEKGDVFDRLDITGDTQILRQIMDILCTLTENEILIGVQIWRDI